MRERERERERERGLIIDKWCFIGHYGSCSVKIIWWFR